VINVYFPHEEFLLGVKDSNYGRSRLRGLSLVLGLALRAVLQDVRSCENEHKLSYLRWSKKVVDQLVELSQSSDIGCDLRFEF